MAEHLLQFQSIIRALMSADNDEKKAAEAQYSEIEEPTRLQYLVQCMISGELLELKTMAASLCRRLLSNMDEFLTVVPAPVQKMCKAQLLKMLQDEPDESMRKKVCDCVAELAKPYIDEEGNNQWPDVLKFLEECFNSGEDRMKECALHIVLAFPGIFGGQQDAYLQVIKEMLVSCISPEAPEKIRLLAAKASCVFTTECVENEKVGFFADVYPSILEMIRISVQQAEDEILLKSFVELVESAPKLVKPHLHDTLDLMLQITSNTSIENNWRYLGLEALVTLAETAPEMIRMHASEYVPKIIGEMLELMVDIKEDYMWSFQDDVKDDTDSNTLAGESSMDRFARALGGETVLPHIVATIPPMLQHSDWRYRHAALMALSAIAEGCSEQLEPLLDSIVNTILPFLVDAHPRVRYAVCNALGQLSTDIPNLFQERFHARVVPGLLKVLENDTAHLRVQAQAAAALVNFTEECPREILTSYLDSMVNVFEAVLKSKLQEFIQRGTKLVLEQILTAIATVAGTAEDGFTKYYEKFMPSLKYIFEKAVAKEYRLLRGKAIDCISVIGVAVGAEKFLPDASDVMELLMKTQFEEIEADDPQISYLMSASARICEIIGKDFVKYLPVVMPHVLKAAQIKPDVILLDMDDPQSTSLDEKDGWEFVNLGEQQKFGIKTAGLEDKSTACQMLVFYARELKEGFLEYTDDVVKTMVPLLKFNFHDTVRRTAAEAMSHLLECAKFKGESYLREIWTLICPELLTAIKRDPEIQVVPELMDSFAKCVEVLPVGFITEEHFAQLEQSIQDKLQKHAERQTERVEKRKGEDYDKDVEEKLQDEQETDSYILSTISDVMHSLFKTHKEAVLPFFENILTDFSMLLEPQRPSSDRQWGLCIFDDLLEYTGPSSNKYRHHFLKSLLSSVSNENPEVRQAAAYGVGLMAHFGGPEYADSCAEMIPVLSAVIAQSDSRAEGNVSATENCISAITKICKYNASKVNVNEVLASWLSWLPVVEDQAEAAHVYGYLCDLIEVRNPTVLGSNDANIPQIISIFAQSLTCEVYKTNPELSDRVKKVVMQIMAMINETVWNATMSALDEEQKTSLKTLLAGNSSVPEN